MEWHLKLADFGISRSLKRNETTVYTSPSGDQRY